MKNEVKNPIIDEYFNLWEDAGVEYLDSARAKAKKQCKSAPLPQDTEQSRWKNLGQVEQWLGDCARCGLCQKRTNIVFGVGDAKAKLMFVGEGPGADEDAQGIPFVGRAGQLLTKIIEAMGYTRNKVYIANVVKCRPPNNRAPEIEEIEQCLPFLQAQLEVIRPRIIVCLGASAAHTLIGNSAGITKMRGKFQSLTWDRNVLVMPTFHPAYLLRNPGAKKLVWEDMKLVKAELEAT